MVDSASAVIVAVITAAGGVIIAFVNRGRRENQNDHAAVMRRLDAVAEDVRDVAKSVASHLRWHENREQ